MPHVPKSSLHMSLVLAFKFVAWLLIMIATLSVAILINWYAEHADKPKPISGALYAAGWLSILVNFVVISLSLDGLQRSIQKTGRFATSSGLLILSCVLIVETLQVYFFHTVTRPDQLHNYRGSGQSVEFSDWLHWVAVAFAGPIVKTVLICAYSRLAGSQEHYVKAHLTIDAQ